MKDPSLRKDFNESLDWLENSMKINGAIELKFPEDGLPEWMKKRCKYSGCKVFDSNLKTCKHCDKSYCKNHLVNCDQCHIY
jgi:hypothetical protein